MDLRTTYLNLPLRTPLIVSACGPLSEDIDNIKRMEDAGASAVVLYSLFEEQLRLETRELEHHMMAGTESFPEALTYFPQPAQFRLGPDGYLDHIQQAKRTVDIPIIASLNGSSMGGWIEFAMRIEQAGADGLELNIYHIPTDRNLSGAAIEQTYVDIVKAVKSAITIPVAVKLSPFFSNMANMAKRLDDTGVDGLVLFNRFYQPDINLEDLEVEPSVILSTPHALRMPMRWVAILFGRIDADLAATSGIHHAPDALKMLMAGADVTMLCSTLLARGIGHIRVIEKEMSTWMEEHWYDSVEQLKGSLSQMRCPDPSAFERAQYMRALTSYKPVPPTEGQ